VSPRDDANVDHLDDRGGTCDTLGLGVLLLPFALVFARGRFGRGKK
jgi:hypothetical protein